MVCDRALSMIDRWLIPGQTTDCNIVICCFPTKYEGVRAMTGCLLVCHSVDSQSLVCHSVDCKDWLSQSLVCHSVDCVS